MSMSAFREAKLALPVQEFTAISAKKDEKLETAIKAAYKHKNITTALTFSHLGKVDGSYE